MRSAFWLFIIGIQQLGAFPAVAQAAEGTLSLTWKAALEKASHDNADVRAAQAALESQLNQEGVARSGFFPDVSASLGATRFGSESAGSVITTSGGTSVVSGSSNADTSYSATLTASQNLFNGLRDIEKIRQASARARGLAASLDAAKAKASFELKSSFQGLLYAQSNVQLTSSIVKRREDNARLVELRFESGRENKGSVLLSNANLAQAKYDSLQATNSLSSAQASLAQVLGIDGAPELQATGEVPTQSAPEPSPHWTSLAVATPDHLKAQADVEVADSAIALSRAGFFPTLALSGSTSRQGDEFFPKDKRWSIGLTLTLPIFSGGSDLYGTKSAAASWLQSLSAQQSVDRGLLTKLRQAYNGYVEAIARLQVDESFRQAAQVRAEIARSKYNNGLLSFDDWDIIESDLISRQKAYLQSTRERVVAEAAWEQALGKGVIP